MADSSKNGHVDVCALTIALRTMPEMLPLVQRSHCLRRLVLQLGQEQQQPTPKLTAFGRLWAKDNNRSSMATHMTFDEFCHRLRESLTAPAAV